LLGLALLALPLRALIALALLALHTLVTRTLLAQFFFAAGRIAHRLISLFSPLAPLGLTLLVLCSWLPAPLLGSSLRIVPCPWRSAPAEPRFERRFRIIRRLAQLASWRMRSASHLEGCDALHGFIHFEAEPSHLLESFSSGSSTQEA
jgi:hypothetical protein